MLLDLQSSAWKRKTTDALPEQALRDTERQLCVVVLEMPTDLLLRFAPRRVRGRHPFATDETLRPPVAVAVLEDVRSIRLIHAYGLASSLPRIGADMGAHVSANHLWGTPATNDESSEIAMGQAVGWCCRDRSSLVASLPDLRSRARWSLECRGASEHADESPHLQSADASRVDCEVSGPRCSAV